MTTTTTTESTILNGVDAGALRAAVDTIAQDPSHAKTHWQVATHWRGGFRSDTRATQYTIGGQRIAKDFTIRVDEPLDSSARTNTPIHRSICWPRSTPA